MTDAEKAEKLLDVLERYAEVFECETIFGIDVCTEDWCFEHCGENYCPTKECFRHYLLGE